VFFATPEEKREAPKFDVLLPEKLVEQVDPSFIPIVEPPVEIEPEIIPAVIVEAPLQKVLEELPEPVEYEAQRPWMPRHLRSRPSMKKKPQVQPQPPAPAAVPTPPPPPTPPVSVVMSPSIDNAQCPPPEYPRRAQRLRWHGSTLLLVDVDANGNPVKITVRTSSGYEILDNAAMKAVEQWHFHPQKRNGVAEAGQLLVPIRFEAPN
jgi:protein TonB